MPVHAAELAHRLRGQQNQGSQNGEADDDYQGKFHENLL
jgi:hypothetical protein